MSYIESNCIKSDTSKGRARCAGTRQLPPQPRRRSAQKLPRTSWLKSNAQTISTYNGLPSRNKAPQLHTNLCSCFLRDCAVALLAPRRALPAYVYGCGRKFFFYRFLQKKNPVKLDLVFFFFFFFPSISPFFVVFLLNKSLDVAHHKRLNRNKKTTQLCHIKRSLIWFFQVLAH